MKKDELGITLIALVVTIILLLILAGITINLTLGKRGIFQIAKEAGRNYTNATSYEQNRINKFVNEAEDIISRVSASKLPENTLANKVQIGDYVAYNPTKGVTDTSKLTYTSLIGTGLFHGNGASEQTFTANNTIKWRVLSKNETTGEVVLISAEAINADNGVTFTMKGAIGYLYAQQELNEICKIYGYGIGADTGKTFNYEIGDVVEGIERRTITESGARSIDANDINKITKYDPNTFSYESDGVIYKYGKSYSHNIFYPTITTKRRKV